MALLRPTVWTQQPQQPVGIDWSNPITRGVVFALPFGRREAANGKTGTASGTVAQGITSRGLAVKLNGSSYLDFGSTPFIDPTGPFTISLYEETTTAQSYSTLLSLPCGTNQLTWLRGSAAGYYCAVGKSNGTVAQFADAGAQASGERKRFVLTGTALNNYATFRLWMDGIELSRTTQSFGALTTGNTKIGQDGLDNPFNGNIADVTFWNRALSDAEIKSISDNPWQIFKPLPSRIFLPVSAGGGATITATLGTADATGLTAGISASSPTTISASLGTATASGLSATLAQAFTLPANLGTASASGYQAAIAQAATITASLGTAAASGYTASVASAGAVVISANLGAASASGYQANVNGSTTITASLGAATAAGYTAALEVAYTLAANLGTASATGKTATVYANETIAATIGQAVAQGYSATITNAAPAIGRPTSDVSNTGWAASAGTDLYPMLDEVSPDDMDYIYTSALNSTCKLGLNGTQYPGSASQQLSVRASSSTGNSLRIVLKDGLTTVKTQDITLTPTLTTYPLSLTSGEIALISTGALSVEMTSI
jgi:hypothetical protein